MSQILDEVSNNNAWFHAGKEYAKVYSDLDLDNFLSTNDLYTPLNCYSKSSFKEGIFEKLMLILDEKNIDTSYLKEMYLDYNDIPESKNDGYDKYSFYFGYAKEKQKKRNTK